MSELNAPDSYTFEGWREHNFGLDKKRWEALRGGVYWVVGAGTGYGQAISLALAAAGAKVILSGRRREKLEATISEGIQQGLDRTHFCTFPMDFTKSFEIKRTVSSFGDKVEDPIGLVVTAAIPQYRKYPYPLIQGSQAAWSKMLLTNVTAALLTAKLALPVISRQESFKIIFFTSKAGWSNTCGFGPYNISKAALNSLGSSIALEYAELFPKKDIQINVLEPGESRSEMNQGSSRSPFSTVSVALSLLSHPFGGPNGGFFSSDGASLTFGDIVSQHKEPFICAR